MQPNKLGEQGNTAHDARGHVFISSTCTPPSYLLLLVGVSGVGEPKDMRSWVADSWALGRGAASSTMGIRETWGIRE